MKTFKYIFFLLLIAGIGISIYIAVQPNSYTITERKTIAAPSQVIYNNLIDFKNWETWSPWLEQKPDTKLIVSDSTSGIGGTYSWQDNNGKSVMKTLEAIPYQSINQEIRSESKTPSKIQWELKQETAKKTTVTWTISADNLSFYEKGYALLNGGHEKMIRPDIEQGLKKLDSTVIAAMQVYSIHVDGIAKHGGGFYIYKTTSCKINNLQSSIAKVLPQVKAYALKNNIATAGAPFINYIKWDDANNAVIFSACVPTTTQITTTEADILTGQIEPFKAVKTTLKGNYSNLKEAWDTTFNYIEQYSLQTTESGPMLEVYMTEATNKPNPANWITELYMAIN